MERSNLRNALGIVALSLGLWLAFGGGQDADASAIPVGAVGGLVSAMPPASSMVTKKNGFHCPPTNLAGTNNVNAKVTSPEFGGQFYAVDIENDTTTAIHICGANAGYGDGGIKGTTEVTTSCPQRCSTCAAGAVYAPDVAAFNTQLMASRNDAGAVTQVWLADVYCFSAGADAGVVAKVNFFK